MTDNGENMSELLPCPFCGGPMENRGYGAIHIGGLMCPLHDLAFDTAKWNTRAPVTVQDAARVPEIAALIEKSEALRADVTGRVDAFGDRIGIAQPVIGFGAKQWADFIAALRTIAEGRA
jgi:hypothetical protein